MTLSPRPNGRIPQDYHTHTNASCDSQAAMAEMCRAALQMGIAEIAFTEHYDLHPKDSCAGFYDPARYFETLDAARGEFGPQGLTIRAGVEVGEYHLYCAQQKPVLDAWPYDVVLGSLHWIGDDVVFDEGYFRARSPREAIEPYFTELLAMVRLGGFDVLAHVDVFKRVAHAVYGAYDIEEWEDYVRPVWQACIEQGIAVEINTASLRRNIPDPHPALAGLRWYRELGGDLLTIGSDGHQPAHVGYGLETALDLARAAGFARLPRYERRQVAGWIAI
jgi:histidinol-phosphatase (PHP family)